MITNLTRKKTISNDSKICRSLFSKSKGLMFTTRVKRPLIFVNKKMENTIIHMFFVFYPIDVAWLDENKRVLHKQTLRPFSVSQSINAKYIIEMKAGSLSAEIGDRLEFEA